MSKFYYADSSALVKRHVSESGSLWIKNEFDSTIGNVVITAKFSVLEVLSALNRRQREASISAVDYQDLATEFLEAVETEYQLIDLTDSILLESKRLLETYPLRAGDSIQLASAVVSQKLLLARGFASLTFLASDVHLLNAAQSEGLLTDDPRNYP